jgi:DNA polymerase (family 10)
MLTKREGFELEWEKIFAVCKKNNIALEINAWPERLDLPDILVREAIKNGVKLVINTDAHAISQMPLMFYGVAVARRGWAKKSDIINTLTYEKFRKWLLG